MQKSLQKKRAAILMNVEKIYIFEIYYSTENKGVENDL